MFRRMLFFTLSLILIFSFLFHPDILTIIAGIALFLFGMLCLEQGFRQASGGVLAQIIQRVTGNRWSSYGFGVLATGLLQSSSLSSVIIVSFVSTGLVSLAAGLALVVGSGLGATFGTWLIAGFGMKVAISHYAMPLLVMGTVLQLQGSYRARSTGHILLGIGFLFLSIHYIRQGMTEAGDLSLLTSDYGLWGGIAVGVVLTVLMQSSHALLVLVIAAMSNNLLNFEQALALCIGTNIGTTTTAALAAISATTDGRRLALGNLLFKVIAALAILPVFSLMPMLLQQLSQPLGMGDAPTLQLALFHSLYNLVGALLTLTLLNPMIALLNRLIPSPQLDHAIALPLPREKPVRARLLTDAVMEHPDAALQALKIESGRLYQRTVSLIGFALYVDQSQLHDHAEMPLSDTIPPWPNWRIGKLYKLQVRALHEDIVRFSEATIRDASPAQRQNIRAILLACENFISAIKRVRLLQKSLRRNIRTENTSVRRHYLRLRRRIITTIRRIHELAENDDMDITRAVHTLRKELHKQDLLTGDSLATLLQDNQTNAAHVVQMINDNGTAHDVCNSLIDGAVILLLQGEQSIIQQGAKPSSKRSAPFWQSHHWKVDIG